MLPVSASENKTAFARLAAMYPTPAIGVAAGAAPTLRSAGASDGCDEAFVLLRPAAVKAGLVSEICKRLQQRGLRLSGLKMLKPGSDLVRAHCEPSRLAADGAADAHRALALDLAAGPVVATLWRGAGALAASLALIGDADPSRALPGTVRGDFDLAIAGRLVEVAPTAAEGARLRRLWLTEDDIVDGKAAATPVAVPPSPAVAPTGKPGGPTNPRAGSRFYITTAINYANGPPHMGHAYEAVTADVIARYHRAYGREVFFLTGSDEHGQKIADTAAAQKLQPIQLCDKAVEGFQMLNFRLSISNDFYVRTTSKAHMARCQAFWTQALEKGDVYLGTYEGWYNVREETFVTETEAAATDFLDPSSGHPLKKVQEESYLFRLSNYHQAIEAHIRQCPQFVQPETRRNEILDRLKEPLRDLSVSRTAFSWGIPVPNNPKHVMYVWFDALTNYLSGIDHPSGANARFWPADVHIIGKDILWFHSIIWPALLLSAGLPLPKAVVAHGFVHGPDGRKMSKSIGNVVDPMDVLNRHSVDVFRFFLVRESPFGGDLTFSEDALVLRQNAELADNYGNLVHRATVLCKKDADSKVPSVAADAIIDVGALREAIEDAYADFALDHALQLALRALDVANKYVTDVAPWKLPQDDPRRLVAVRTLLEVVYVCTHFLSPVLVEAAGKVFTMLGTPAVPIGQLKPCLANLTPGTPIGAAASKKAGEGSGDVLFDKGETGEVKARIAAEGAKKKAAKEEADRKRAAAAAAEERAKAGGSTGGPEDDLHKLDLRVGKVVQVAKHPEADALYVEQVDLGEPSGPRRVVSGLVKYMSAETLLNRRVVLLANTKPSKLKGVESQAMLLCAFSADGATCGLLTPPPGAPLGQRIVFDGHDAPAEAVLHPKKKIWESLQPDMNTDADGVARYKSLAYATPHGPCVAAEVPGGIIK